MNRVGFSFKTDKTQSNKPKRKKFGSFISATLVQGTKSVPTDIYFTNAVHT